MVQQKILKHLILDEEYTRKTLPFIKSEYFQESSEKLLFSEIESYVNKYNTMPTQEALAIEIDKRVNLTDDQHKKQGNKTKPGCGKDFLHHKSGW